MKEMNHQNIFKTQRPKNSMTTFTEIDIDKLTIKQMTKVESGSKKAIVQKMKDTYSAKKINKEFHTIKVPSIKIRDIKKPIV